MNKALIDNWNSKIKPGDVVFHLGDVGFGHHDQNREVIKQLNGHRHLILGNHDHAKDYYSVFSWVGDYLEIKVADPDAKQSIQRIVLFHYAMRVWNQSHRGAWQLYGHSHGTLPEDPTLLSMDVGVDPRGYYPIGYLEVKELMKKKTPKPSDYHGRE
jgi:calcineurin-like phosphoesterase family protein